MLCRRFCFLLTLLTFSFQTANGAGIPIIKGASIKIAIQEEVKKQIAQQRREMIKSLETSTGVQISEDRNTSDTGIAANTAGRITGALSDVHNKKADIRSAPYLDACSAVSVARTVSSSASNDFHQNDLPNRVSALTRADQNPAIRDSLAAYAEYDGENVGSVRNTIRQQMREWNKERMAMLDQAIVDVDRSPDGFLEVFTDTVQDDESAGRIYFLRSMVLGPGLQEMNSESVPNKSSRDMRARDMLTEASEQTKRSVQGIVVSIMNHQTAVIETNYLPLEGAIDAMADPANQERLAVNATNEAVLMTDRAMLQSFVINKSASLTAMLREYRRGQADLLQLAALTLQADE
jgi:hypothetical protein